jgi:serine/threonine protein kinase
MIADQGPLSGKLLGGRYQLGERLGRGGFADVYLGEHLHLKMTRAIKVLHTLLTGEDVAQFRNEARLVAHLDHPHILKIHDFDLEQGLPFLVMDYAPNGSLRQRHSRGERVPLVTIVSYVKQIAGALQYAHDQKVIHRDIKPENLLLGRINDILLSDFGIAVVAQSTSQQRTQEFAGTAAYSAPEQLQGKPHLASDQYALGIIVYEWLTGVVPFRGSYLEVASQHVLTPPPSPRARVPDLAPAIEHAVLTTLSKEPAHRFARVQEFAEALEQACQTKTIFAATTRVIPRTSQPTIQAISSPLTATEQLLPPAAVSSIKQQTREEKSSLVGVVVSQTPRPSGKSKIAPGLKTIRRWSNICLITQILLSVLEGAILALIPEWDISAFIVQGFAVAVVPFVVFLFVSIMLVRTYTADSRALTTVSLQLVLWPIGFLLASWVGFCSFPPTRVGAPAATRAFSLSEPMLSWQSF